LSHLAVQRNNSVSTQRTALNAIIFLFREFLEQPLDELSFEMARKPRRLPTVFTHNEARAVISHLEGYFQLVARLMCGSGLRINEALRLRVKDVDFGMQQIIVRSGKGNKDRTSLAVPVSRCKVIHGSAQQCSSSAPLAGPGCSTGHRYGYSRSGDLQTSKQPRSPPQLRDPATGSRIRYSHHSETSGPCRCAYHRNIHARCLQGWVRCAQSC